MHERSSMNTRSYHMKHLINMLVLFEVRIISIKSTDWLIYQTLRYFMHCDCFIRRYDAAYIEDCSLYTVYNNTVTMRNVARFV